MKKYLSKMICVVLAISMCLAGCGNMKEKAGTEDPFGLTDEVQEEESQEETVVEETETDETEEIKEKEDRQAEKKSEKQTAELTCGELDPSQFETEDELEEAIETQFTEQKQAVIDKWTQFSEEIDSYQKYVENAENVTEFYETLVSDVNQIGINLRKDAVVYAQWILASDMDADDKYDAVDDIKDLIYDDLCDDLNDDIYDDLMGDIEEKFYEGIVKDGEAEAAYDDWYDVSSDEYSQWYDASSDVYEIYYDTQSDVYGFCYDLSSDLYDCDFDKAEETVDKFVLSIEEMEARAAGEIEINISDFDTAIRDASYADELEDVIETHVAECLAQMQEEWTTLSTDIDSYEKYTEGCNRVEEFYGRVADETTLIMIMLREYAIEYTELILNSDDSYRDKYKDLEDVYECIYEDACDEVYDEVYDGLLKDMYDYYYDGVLEDARNSVKYSIWSEYHGDEYGFWSDARKDVYGAWSDARGDVYGFYSDIRREVYQDDKEGEEKKLTKFKEKVEKMK